MYLLINLKNIIIPTLESTSIYNSEDFEPLACRFTTNISGQTLARLSNNIVIRIHV